MSEIEIWEEKLKTRIINAYHSIGTLSPSALAEYCEGASPKDISKILEKLSEKEIAAGAKKIDFKAQSNFFFRLPAANPEFFQWWYTLESQEKLASIISEHLDIRAMKGLCLGTPTIAAYLHSMNVDTTLLDIDSDIINCYKQVMSKINNDQSVFADEYDVYQEINSEYKHTFDYVVIDPPWYQPYFIKFINRAITSLKNNGIIFCSIPKVLTRENVQKQREELINSLSRAGHELLFIQKGTIKYIVPKFEEEALSSIDKDFEIKPWRSSDLIAIKVNNGIQLELESTYSEIAESCVKLFSRKKSQTLFRAFLDTSNTNTSSINAIKEISKYSETVSKRDVVENFNLWTSNKKAFCIKDLAVGEKILTSWSSGETKAKTVEQLALLESVTSQQEAQELFDEYESKLELWSQNSEGDIRRTDEKIKELTLSINDSNLSSPPSEREHLNSSDGYRIEFQRDRDRIIWSSGFRKLSDKTQLFPLDEDEHLRQRLAHSIEVSQLASTIAASFGLDKDLVEAGALAHDIGHTPFGHAGEHALDILLKKHLSIDCGFNHYEHGVDVVRYLEGPYQNRGFDSHAGLDLTPEVCDCILKHTYCHHGSEDVNSIYANSKHQDIIKGGYSHLEGQAVRAADKISYLLSDIEDGIKLNAITYTDLISCRLFHRSPVDFRLREGESLYSKFIEQRGSIIKLLMEDVILESSKRLSKIKSRQDVFTLGDYAIFHSPTIDADMDEVWKKIQVAKLHKDPRVLSANLNASRMVSELTILYIAFPSLIDNEFRKEHIRLDTQNSAYMKFYNSYGSGKNKQIKVNSDIFKFMPMDRVIGEEKTINFANSVQDINVYDIVLAKDYVASLTDKKIKKLYANLVRT